MIVGLFRQHTKQSLCANYAFNLTTHLFVKVFFDNAILLLNFARQNVVIAIDLQEFVARQRTPFLLDPAHDCSGSSSSDKGGSVLFLF